MLKVLLFLLVLLFFVDDGITSDAELDVIKYGTRVFGDMPIFIENHRTSSDTLKKDDEARNAVVHWIGNNETYTQVYFEALNWDYASFDDPWMNTYRANREFTLQIYGNTQKMYVNLIVFGFTNRPLPNSENDLASDGSNSVPVIFKK